MAVTERQASAVATSGGGATSVAMTLGSATAASGLLVAFGFTRDTFTTISDTGGRTWTQQFSFTNANGNTAFKVWTAPTGVGGDTPTVTANTSASNWVQGCLVEVAGCDTSTTPVSVSATQTQGTAGTTLSIGPTGTSGASELAIAFVGDDGGSTWTAPAGWATAIQQGSLAVAVSWKSVASQTVTAAWTLSANEPCGGVVLVIKAAAVVSSTVGWQPIRPLNPPGASPGKFGRFYQSPKAYLQSSTSQPLSGVSAGSSTDTGALTGTGTVSGVSVSLSADTGALTGSGTLTGVSVSTSADTGNLALLGILSGISVASSADTGLLTGTGTLSGISVSTSADNADLQASGVLSGVSVSTSVGTGSLTAPLTPNLFGVSVSTSTGTGSLTALLSTSGISISTSVGTGNLLATGVISGVSASTSADTGSLTGAGSLSGLSVSVSASYGDLQALSAGAITGISVSTSASIGDLGFNFTPPVSPGGGGGGGSGGWSPKFEFSTTKRPEILHPKRRRKKVDPATLIDALSPPKSDDAAILIEQALSSEDEDEDIVYMALTADQNEQRLLLYALLTLLENPDA